MVVLPRPTNQLLMLFTDRVGLATPGAKNSRGETGFDPAVFYPSRIEYETKEVRTNTQETRMSHVQAYIMAAYYNDNNVIQYLTDLPDVHPEWQITLPGGSHPIILRVDKNYFGDMSHLVVYTLMPELGEVEFTVDISGVDTLMQQFTGWLRIATQEEADLLHADLVDLLEIIQKEYVPVEEGELRDSGFVDDPEQTSEGFEIAMGFTAEHATIQHERLDYNHPNGGQAKFLEEPLAAFLDIYTRQHR